MPKKKKTVKKMASQKKNSTKKDTEKGWDSMKKVATGASGRSARTALSRHSRPQSHASS